MPLVMERHSVSSREERSCSRGETRVGDRRGLTIISGSRIWTFACLLVSVVGLELDICMHVGLERVRARIVKGDSAGAGMAKEEEEVMVVFDRENRGGSAQHATRATPTRSSHGPMRA